MAEHEGWTPDLPPGRPVRLPGRGTTFVREVAGPAHGDPSAPVLVLLHGWTVTADLNWFTAYRALGRTHRVLAVDHRGHGRGIASRRRFRLADCADDVAALCDVLGVARIVPVGYSMGGPVALLTWRRHPELVDGLVLCATAPRFRGQGPERHLFGALPVAAAAGRLVPGPVRRRAAAALLDRREDASPVGRWAGEQVTGGDPVAKAEAGAAIGRFDATGWLAEVDVPTAVVRTLHDRAVPPVRQTRLAEGIPGASIHDVAGDHTACVTAADRFVPALRAAVADVHARAAARR